MSALSHWQKARGDSGADEPGLISPAAQAPSPLVQEENKPPVVAELSIKELNINPDEQVQETVTIVPLFSPPVPPHEDITSIPKQFLPLQEATIPQPSTLGASEAPTKRKSILVVDDNAINLRVRRQCLPF